ncbi:MAG TPA: GAF domain-containing protein [Gemmatimonadales bacterium]|jgi:signal transduction histidine kinase|nr:GAF domain-containing protein [Gemmatimonadales bacterium]
MVLEASAAAPAVSEHAGWSRLIHTLTAAGDPHSLFNRICRDVAEGFGFSRALFASVDPRRAVLAARGGYDPAVSPHVSSALLMLYRVPLDPDAEGKYVAAAWCVNKREQVWIHDANHYDFRPEQTKQLTLLIKAFGVQEYVLTPVVWAGQSIGMLGVDKKGQTTPFTRDDLEELRSIAELIAWRLGPLLLEGTPAEVAIARPPGPRPEQPDLAPPGASEPGLVASLLDGLDEGVLLLNPDGRIRYGNRAVLAMLETFPWELSGKRLPEALPLAGLEDLLAGIQGAGTQPLFPLRGRLERPGKPDLELELRLLALSSGPTRAWGVMLRNLGQKGSLDQLRNYSLAMLVHDLKAPVQSVIGFAELLRLGRMGTVNPEQSDFLRRIEEGGEGILRLVEKALEVGEFDSLAPLLSEPTEVGPLVEGVLRQLAGKAALAGVRLENQVPAEFPLLWADRDRMIQVFQNLIDNAIDASQPGGSVRVVGAATVRYELPAAEFQIVTERVRLAEDPAPGVRRRAPALGLTIARLVIQAHGGETTLQDLDAGVAVRFVVPFGTDPASARSV